MFTGIIEAIGKIEFIEAIDSDKKFVIISDSLNLSDVEVGDSISVNGVCLTITDLQKKSFSVDVSVETLSCTTFNDLTHGDKVNLEKALQLSSRLGGHMVSGHVDGKGIIQTKFSDSRSEHFEIGFSDELRKYICRKGSICIDGVSLTINDTEQSTFSVNIIPHTFKETIFSEYIKGRKVNLEVDIVARYMESLVADRN